jgi:hypothetical protein
MSETAWTYQSIDSLLAHPLLAFSPTVCWSIIDQPSTVNWSVVDYWPSAHPFLASSPSMD